MPADNELAVLLIAELADLSSVSRERIIRKGSKADFKETAIHAYLKFMESLIDNQPYF